MPRAARKKTVSNPAPAPAAVREAPDPHLHAGKCTICKHPQRVEIERAFVEWTSPREIVAFFGLRSATTVYRHAHARGLFELRRRNLHFGLARIAEHVADVKPSAANVIAAFIAMAKINARGEWNSGARFDYYQASERARWESLETSKRDSDLSDTLAGKPTRAQAAQKRFLELDAECKAAAAAAAAQVRAARQTPELRVSSAPAEPAFSPIMKSLLEKSAAPDPQPPPAARQQPSTPPAENSAPPQVAGLVRPREKIAFNRRRWRPPLH